MSSLEATSRRAPIAYNRVQATPGNWLREYGQPIKGLNTSGGPTLQALLDPAWLQQSVCASVDPDLWFEESDSRSSRRAIALCRKCPVRAICLASALVFREEYGISGGLTSIQRRPLEIRLSRGEALGRVLAVGLGTSAVGDHQGAA